MTKQYQPAKQKSKKTTSVNILQTLLLGNPAVLAGWLDRPDARRITIIAGVTFLGLAVYGASVGFWRSPKMGGYVAIKMPLLIAFTLGCNALFNGFFGLLLGSGLDIKRSIYALLMSFAVAAMLLGALSPITFFLATSLPTSHSPEAKSAHAIYLLIHTFLIGYAGIVANLHLHNLLYARSASHKTASLTLLAWLGGNAFLGAQFSWILRPFFGSPQLDVAFLRPHPMQGNFYAAVWHSALQITGSSIAGGYLLAFILTGTSFPVLTFILRKKTFSPSHSSHPNHSPQNKQTT